MLDVSAKQIAGAYLYEKPELKQHWLYDIFAVSDRLWDRRIAMIATHYFISKNQFDDTLRLAEMFLGDSEDLMHKATGWMLREVGKQV
jgi:3-methyladenine DNA glycosylase AlkD